jgi:molybdate transport system permease protein
VHVPPGKLIDALGSSAARDALVVSIKTSLIAHLAVLLVGTPAAYAIGRNRFRGRALVLSLIELPLVVPPVVAGIALLVTFGRFGLLGGTLDAFGLSVSFTQAAVVIAIAFVESPFYIRGAIASFEGIDDTLLEAARTLGARPFRVFARVAVPLAAGGLARPRRSRSRGDSASSGPPSSSPAACKGSRRPFRLRSTRNSRCPSTRRWRSARSSSSSASRSC